MNIGLFCNEFPPRHHGGIGTFIEAFARGLLEAGHHPTVVELGDRRSERTTEQGVRVVTLPRSPLPRPISWYLNRRTLRQFLHAEVRRGRIEMIEVPEFQGWLPGRFDDCPVSVRLHLSATTISHLQKIKVSRVMTWCERKTLRAHRNWIAVSQYAAQLTHDSFPGIEPARRQVIHYPIVRPNESAVLGGDVPDQFVLYAGTVSRRKGAMRLAEAARSFLIRFPGLHLVYAGTVAAEGDKDAAQIVRLILGQELSARCRFLGLISRAALLEWMKRARVFAFPSHLETFGLVVAEAMSVGCAVVATDMPPFTEFVTNGQTGLLVAAEDGQPQPLAHAIETLVADRDLAHRLGEAARLQVRDAFSIESTVAQSVAFYRQCLAGHPRAAGNLAPAKA